MRCSDLTGFGTRLPRIGLPESAGLIRFFKETGTFAMIERLVGGIAKIKKSGRGLGRNGRH